MHTDLLRQGTEERQMKKSCRQHLYMTASRETEEVVFLEAVVR